jgi:hypothetical protein
MPDVNKRDYSPVSNPKFGVNHKVRKQAREEKKAEIKHHNSKAEQKGLKETYERLAEQENRKREEINKTIKEQGYYNGPNGEHYEVKLKKVNADYFAKQKASMKVRPTFFFGAGLLNRIDVFINTMMNRVATFFANLFTRGKAQNEQIPSEYSEAPNAFSGTKKMDISYDDTIVSKDKSINLVNELYQQNEKSGISNAKREFQLWMNSNREYTTNPRDMVFDYMKAATLQGIITDEKGITDALTYAFENKCEYSQENDTVLMYFQMKNGEIGAIGVNGKGEIFTPETVVVDGNKIQNPITMEKMGDKIPEKVAFMSEQIKESQGLLRQFSNEVGFSKDSLQQVREYLERNDNHDYDEHLKKIEETLVDRNAIGAINEFITKVDFRGEINDVNTVMNVSVLRPMMMMNQMANPGQYSPVFNQAYDQLTKGLSIDNAFAVAETMLVNKDNELTIVPRETQKLITLHIDELQAKGIPAKDVIGIVQSYNESSIEMAQINKQLIDFEISNGASAKDVIATKREMEINIEKIAESIEKEMTKLDANTVIEDARNNAQNTITGIYLANLKQQEVLLVAEKLPEGYIREGFMVAAGLSQEEFIPENNTVDEENRDAVYEDGPDHDL